MTWPKQTLALVFLSALVLAAGQWGCAYPAAHSPSPPATQSALTTQPAPETPEQLQQLVAPIALYPDQLVAEILAASTYPAQIVEADRWLQQHTNLKGEQLMTAVNQQPWDPSVKALTQFPSVLANLDKNLSWTSELGDAYVNQQQDVLNAVQAMRTRAQDAGSLKSTPQQTVTTQGQTIIIEPANPQVVYVPEYNPWIVYGAPIAVYPGYIMGTWIDAPFISFGVGIPVGSVFIGCCGWGWDAWGFDWPHRTVIFNHNTFISRSHTFINRDHFFRRGPEFGHDEARAHRNFEHNREDARGFGEPHGQMGTHSGAFSGFDHGGNVRSFAFRGRSSFGGGFHGGGGGMHAGGGGFHGGGGGSHGGGGGHR